jgi:lysophospholipase L1-like esterase
MGLRVLWIGDSILEGMAPNLPDAYRESGWAVDVRAESHSGWSTARWLREGDIARLVAEFNPFIVVVALGTNDEGEERNPDRYAANIQAMVDLIGSVNGAATIWIGAFTGPGIAARYRVIESVLGDLSIDGSMLMPGVSMASEIHPNAEGYKLLARRAVQAVWALTNEDRPIHISMGGVGGSAALPILAGAFVGAVLVALIV